MGFSTLIDIMGSIVIGGMLMLILFRLNDASVENSFLYNGELIIQKNLVEVVDLLEYDLRKIGYCANWKNLPDPSKYIKSVDSNSISYYTDVDSDGNVDSLSYYLGPASALSHTPNPRDRMLYRKVNNEKPLAANLGVTQFEFTFFDVFGNQIPFPIAVPGQIQTMQIDIAVEDIAAYDENYQRIFWRQIRLAARNLRNR
ncbi:MAG: hypothetical protein ABFS12_01170 [Bacteroidota bacterium]